MTENDILKILDNKNFISCYELEESDYKIIKQLLEENIIEEIFNNSPGVFHAVGYKLKKQKVINHPDLTWINKL